jgi:short-subunit dehydrogenase
MTQETQEAPGLALVTGASSGIGRSLARQLAERGYDVVITAEDDELHAAAADLRTTGREVVAVQADLRTPEGVEDLYRQASGQGRPLTVVALNAGVGVGGRFVDTSLADHLDLVDLAKLVVDDMVQRGEGKILVTASIASTGPGPYHSTYAASKAFVHSFAEGIRHELQDTGVSVTSLMPGPTDTEFFERADMEDTKIGQGPKDDPEDVARDGIDALLAGKPSVVAGSVKNTVMANVATHLPDRVASAAMAGQTKPQDEGS